MGMRKDREERKGERSERGEERRAKRGHIAALPPQMPPAV
jgi:hypothetical protein